MKKILIIQQKMIGDVLVSSLLCEHLKIHYPDSEIHYVVNEHTVAVVEHNPFIDRIVVFKHGYRNNKLKFLAFLQSISREEYDVVIDIYGKLESNLITLFSGAKIKIAYPKWYSKFIYTHQVALQPRKAGKNGITVEDRLGLLAPLINTALVKKREPTISLTPDEIDETKLFLESRNIEVSRPILMLAVLGSHPSKTYPLEYMAQVIDTVAHSTEVTVLFNYIPSQQLEVQKLYDLCSKETRAKIAFGAFAPSLRKFLGLLYHCDALIGNEGGAINMAKALNIPTFSIYSPWINKMAWHTFDKDTNAAVHLSDYHPELIQGKPKKQLKKEISELYEKFKPELFIGTLLSFLEVHVLTDQ